MFVHLSTQIELSRGFWCWETSLFAIGFFSLGHLLKDKLLSLKYSIVLFVIYLACALSLGLTGLLSDIDMHLNHFNNPLAYSVSAVLGCISCVCLMSHLPSFKHLAMFGRYTLFMFPFHIFALRYVMSLYTTFCNDGIFARVGVIIITSILCFIISHFVYKYIPSLGGKKKWIK